MFGNDASSQKQAYLRGLNKKYCQFINNANPTAIQMTKSFLTAVLALALLSACHDQHREHEKRHAHNAATEPAQTEEDSLYREVIALHDAVMPKMGKLIGYKKALQAKIDSLDNTVKDKKGMVAVFNKKQYVKLLAQVDAAEKAMNDWMDQFNPDPKLPTQEEMVHYFEDQKAKAAAMKHQVLAALDSAAAKL